MDKKQRKAKIIELLRHMKSGNDVPASELKKVLTTEQYKRINAEWKNENAGENSLKEKPDEIKDYEGLLKIADFLHNRSDASSQRRKKIYDITGKSTAQRLSGKADTAYEQAWVWLQENVATDPDLRRFFDRYIDIDTMGHEPSLCPSVFPRFRGSKSRHNQSPIVLGPKHPFKQAALDEALNKILKQEVCEEKGITNEDLEKAHRQKWLGVMDGVESLRKLVSKCK